jgi:hypothetical protein
MCYGTCPVYTVTIDRHGRFTWLGEHFVPVVGRYEGEFVPELFTALAEMIDRFGFFDWNDEYVSDITDMPDTILTVERAGVTKRVLQNGTNEPPGLDVLATFIDGIISHALWDIEIGLSRHPAP